LLPRQCNKIVAPGRAFLRRLHCAAHHLRLPGYGSHIIGAKNAVVLSYTSTGRSKTHGTGCAKAFAKTSDFRFSFDFYEQHPSRWNRLIPTEKSHAL
jgi:hypothetical protein